MSVLRLAEEVQREERVRSVPFHLPQKLSTSVCCPIASE